MEENIMNEQSQRVNKITALFNGQDGVTITLYRTHNRLGQLTNKDLDVPDFKDSKATNKMAYMTYCREMVTNLLTNNGIEGYYYDPENKSEQSQQDIPKKFGNVSFVKCAIGIVTDKMKELIEHKITDITAYDVNGNDQDAKIAERYKDGNIKYGAVDIAYSITLENNDKRYVTDKLVLNVNVEIKSGQLCKPKAFTCNGIQYSLNETNLKNVLISNLVNKKEPKIKTPAISSEQPTKTDENMVEDNQPKVADGGSSIGKLMNALKGGK